MKLQISELAKQTGVSVRTLHYYDTIGLLKPSEVDPITGYRFYNETSMKKLKEILYYRKLHFPLKEIPELISEKDVIKRSKLLKQRKFLQEKRLQIDLLLNTIAEDLSSPIALHNWFDKILQDYNYSGFSYQSGKDHLFYSWGKADYENNKPFSLTSRYPIGSMTKQFTAFCTLLLADQGLLNTEDYIGVYLPECQHGDKVKLIHLLNMTSGLSYQLVSERFTQHMNTLLVPEKSAYDTSWVHAIHQSNAFFSKKKSLEELLEIIHYAPLKFIPGEQFDFCEINYELLGWILEHISGTSLDALFQKYIFTPLEMQNTSYQGTPDIIGYVAETPLPPFHAHDGAQGLLSTAEDLDKWYNALLGRKLLSERGYQILLTPNNFNFSCGWYLNGGTYSFTCSTSEISSEAYLNFEKAEYYLSVRNQAPLPANNTRVMYLPVTCCDDGFVKLEALELDTDASVKITSIKIFDRNSKELYSFSSAESEYLLFVENHEEKQYACDFITNASYYLLLDFVQALGEQYDATATYLLEVRAECDSPRASQIGIKYQQHGENKCMGYYIFFNYIQPYELFMEALENVMEVV